MPAAAPAQAVMPLLLAAILMFGVGPGLGWRLALVVPGVLMLIMACRVLDASPRTARKGNYADLRAAGIERRRRQEKAAGTASRLAAANYRVWLLFVTYGACFGVEIFIHNMAAIYLRR